MIWDVVPIRSDNDDILLFFFTVCVYWCSPLTLILPVIGIRRFLGFTGWSLYLHWVKSSKSFRGWRMLFLSWVVSVGYLSCRWFPFHTLDGWSYVQERKLLLLFDVYDCCWYSSNRECVIYISQSDGAFQACRPHCSYFEFLDE